MENVVRLPVDAGHFWRGRKVLVTGHTGFKGSWLSLWLLQLGAHLHGLALAPDSEPNLFHSLRLADEMEHDILDIRNAEDVTRLVARVRPEIVFHLAAQPLVLRSYDEPAMTWHTNVNGTLNLLEALRQAQHPATVVIVTTDKVYENREWEFAYRESDRLGGHDPYSASKAATELLAASWRRSFGCVDGLRIVTARAGNVIGGGDWAENRIIPDLVRALSRAEVLQVRNPHAIRPWQHVLDPLAGYLLLAQRVHEREVDVEAVNFGPYPHEMHTVGELVSEALECWPRKGAWRNIPRQAAPKEAGRLTLAIDRALTLLGWRPCWNFRQTVQHTMTWYAEMLNGTDAREITETQIRQFEKDCWQQ